jgi:crotonobetainyl-CoA:carnitine CoA-transferase CaiB-like acyl-CoA transferase
MSLTGDPDGAPTKSGPSLVDLSGGYVSAIALLAGLWRARRDGVGCDCDISLFETALAELCYVGTWTAGADYEPPRYRNSAHPSVVPFQNFESADGWLVIAGPKQKFFDRLCAAIGAPELATDPRFTNFEHPTAHSLEQLTEVGVRCAPVNDVAAALEDPLAHLRWVESRIQQTRAALS